MRQKQPDQCLAEPFKHSVFMVFNIRIRIQVSAILIFVILLTVLSLLSIQSGFGFGMSCNYNQEDTYGKNRRMENFQLLLFWP